MFTLKHGIGFWLACLIASTSWAKDAPATNNTTSIPPLKVDVLAKTSQSWQGRPLPHYQQGQPEVTILRIVIPPKGQVPWHKHPVVNAAVMLEGELHVIAEGGHELTLNKGDAIVEVVDHWHYGINKGNKPVELIVFYAGNVGVPLSVARTIDSYKRDP